MHGPPGMYGFHSSSSYNHSLRQFIGNGKTISLKAIMKSCDALGFSPLYVKSFQSSLPKPIPLASTNICHFRLQRRRRGYG